MHTSQVSTKFREQRKIKKMKEEDDPDKIEEHERIPTHIRVQFSDRTLGNKLLYLLYKVFRILYTSVWFYFLPFVAMICSYAVPYYAC